MAQKVILVKDFPVNVQAFIAFAQNVVTCWTGNTLFPNPPVSLASVTASINLLVAAEAFASTNKSRTATTDRNNKRSKVNTALGLLLSYAQSIIDTLSIHDGQAAATSSGFRAKKPSPHPKQDCTIARGPTAGSVVINLKALGKHGTVQYCHQYMLAGATTWVDLAPTLQTKTSVSGLPVGTTVQFRFRTLIKGVYSDWTQPLNFAVH